jgi:hypothetical protein
MLTWAAPERLNGHVGNSGTGIIVGPKLTNNTGDDRRELAIEPRLYVRAVPTESLANAPTLTLGEGQISKFMTIR